MTRAIAAIVIACVLFLIVGMNGGLAASDGPLKQWFESLRSKNGFPCCDGSDGFRLSDPDWEAKDGKYRVSIKGRWYDVPDHALITVPNRVGQAMVWPTGEGEDLQIRCFMPGAMT